MAASKSLFVGRTVKTGRNLSKGRDFDFLVFSWIWIRWFFQDWFSPDSSGLVFYRILDTKSRYLGMVFSGFGCWLLAFLGFGFCFSRIKFPLICYNVQGQRQSFNQRYKDVTDSPRLIIYSMKGPKSSIFGRIWPIRKGWGN